MTFEEFKGTCFHTQYTLRVPALGHTYGIDKVEHLMTKGKYDPKKEDKVLRELWDKYKSKLGGK